MSALIDTVFEMDDFLGDLGVRYAVGGGLALQRYSNPRVTVDIDLNLALPFASATELVDALEPLGYRPMTPSESWVPIAGVRFHRERSPVVDIFFACDKYHDTIMLNAVRMPFETSGRKRTLLVLSADDLVVVKMSFNRSKDWTDIESMIDSGTAINPEYVSVQLVSWRGPMMWPRVARLRTVQDAASRRAEDLAIELDPQEPQRIRGPGSNQYQDKPPKPRPKPR